jgi:hypothetical protein
LNFAVAYCRKIEPLAFIRSVDPSVPVDGLVDILRLVSRQTGSNRREFWHAGGHD